jgi:hypothetical protein
MAARGSGDPARDEDEVEEAREMGEPQRSSSSSGSS